MEDLREVAAVHPPAAYIGGKRRLGELLARRIEAIPHRLYAEPFVGMGGVFFRRRYVPRCEVVNDVSRDVTTLFRILQRHYPQFMDTLKFQVTSRREFERLAACDPATLTDLERAARFLYLQRLAFGGKVTGRNFGVETSSGAGFNVSRLGPLLEEIHERLSGVIIECLTWSDFVDRYDLIDTLFFLDPPYWGTEGEYGAGVFARADFPRVADRLASIKGRFLLTVNDLPQTREVFSRFVIEPVTTRYTVAGGAGKTAAEILVMGPGSDPEAFPKPRDLLSL